MIKALQCPLCRQTPVWHSAPRATEARGVRCGILVGCSHTQAAMGFAITTADQVDATVERWNTEAERLLTAFTSRWTEAQRATYRASLGYPAAEALKL
jgi:hypothetical protein